jgi:uncharacterized membrane protein
VRPDDLLAAGDAKAIEDAIRAVEAHTGTQIVAAVVPRADRYPELAWRAFASGASLGALGGLLLLAAGFWNPGESAVQIALAQTIATLGAGALAALATAVAAPVARLLIGRLRAEAEVRQCAEAMFLERELFATPRRDAVLVLVARFEQRVVVLPDSAYRDRVSPAEWQTVVDRMLPLLARERTGEAFMEGLAVIQTLLVAKGFTPGSGGNALPDTLVRGSAP